MKGLLKERKHGLAFGGRGAEGLAGLRCDLKAEEREGEEIYKGEEKGSAGAPGSRPPWPWVMRFGGLPTHLYPPWQLEVPRNSQRTVLFSVL